MDATIRWYLTAQPYGTSVRTTACARDEAVKGGRPADAIGLLREAALLQPSNPIVQHDLGLACLEDGRVSEAVAALQRAVTGDPGYSNQALLHVELRR